MSEEIVGSEFEGYEGAGEARPAQAGKNVAKVESGVIADWLNWLWSEVPGQVEIGSASKKGAFSRRRFETIEEAIAFAVERAPYANVYAGMTTRFDDSSSERWNVQATQCLWAELDPPKKDGSGEPLRMSVDEISEFKKAGFKKLSEFEPRPSAIIDSGNGLHAIWVLDQALDLVEDKMKQALEEALIGITISLGPDADLAVTECTRVMRAPGTTNFPNAAKTKLGRIPALCSVIEWEPSRRYSFSEFDKFREIGRDPWRNRNQAQVEIADIDTDWTGDVPAVVRELLQATDHEGDPRHPALVVRWGGNSEGLRDRSGSGIDQSIANFLARRHVEPHDIARALIARSAQLGDPAKGASYYQHTISKAVAFSDQPNSPLADQYDRVEDSSIEGPTRYAVSDGSDESFAVIFRDFPGLGDRWIYVKPRKSWFFWNNTIFEPSEGGLRGKLWRLEEPMRARARAEERQADAYFAEAAKFQEEIDGIDEDDPGDHTPSDDELYIRALITQADLHFGRAETWLGMARAIRDERRRASVEMALEGMLRVDGRDLDSDRNLLTFPASRDGKWPAVTVELESLTEASTGGYDPLKVRTRRPSPKDHITQQMGCAWIPGSRHAESEQVIRQILPDEDLLKTALQEMGMAMGRRREVQRSAFFYGPGGTGKSTLVQHFLDVFGTNAVRSTPALILDEKTRRNANEHTSALEAVRGKRLVALAEFSSSDHLGSRFKELTGEKSAISRESYGKRTEEMELTPMFVMISNYLVKVDPTDEGIWRRLVPIPCNERFVDTSRLDEGQQLDRDIHRVDRSIEPMMRSEEALVATAQMLMEELALYLTTGEPRPLCQASREELSRLREESNPLEVFVEQNLKVADADTFTPTSEIADRYRTFAAERLLKPIADNQITPLIMEIYKAHPVRRERGRDRDGRRMRGIFGVQLVTSNGHTSSDEFDG